MKGGRLLFSAIAIAVLLLFVTLAGCGDREPEQRKAFLVFLAETPLGKKGAGIPELTREREKAFGVYAGHYALLAAFQRDMRGLAKDADALLRGKDRMDLAAFAAQRPWLGNVAREARELGENTLKLLEKTDEAKKRLGGPADLLQPYDAAYAKTVSRPARLFAAVGFALHEALVASLSVLDFAENHSRDIRIENGQYAIYNRAVEPEFRARESVEREKARLLEKACAAFAEAMAE